MLVTDNWYGSLEALDVIHKAGDCSVLMMRTPRPISSTSPLWKTSPLHRMSLFITDKSPKGERKAAFFEEEAMLMFWRDNKVVVLLTDACNDQHDEKLTAKRNGKGNQLLEVPSTQVVELYNKWKSLVDRFNQKRAEADTNTHYTRWWVRNFINRL